jgi:hypothetical protein
VAYPPSFAFTSAFDEISSWQTSRSPRLAENANEVQPLIEAIESAKVRNEKKQFFGELVQKVRGVCGIPFVLCIHIGF